MPKLEHVALGALDLGQTRAFYEKLGGAASFQGEKRLTVVFGDGCRLIFDLVNALPGAGAVTYLGLELPEFGEVDAAFARFAGCANMGRDMRADYAKASGPYGFFVRDPSGYPVKVFKYNEGA